MAEKKAVEEAGISRKTIVFLVVLTVVVSLISTFIIFNRIGSIKAVPEASQNADNAKLQLTIIEPPVPSQDSASGKVSLEILEPPE